MAHAEPTWAPSWPWALTTNAALPMRLRPQIFWSRRRASRIVRYMPTRSSLVNPNEEWRSWRCRAERSSASSDDDDDDDDEDEGFSSTLATVCLLLHWCE